MKECIEVINVDTGDIDYLASSTEDAYNWINETSHRLQIAADTWTIEE